MTNRLVRAWLLTALVDFLFSSVLVTVFYHSTFARLWQGVASTLLGPAAIGGGTQPLLIGLVMHLGVAFGWSAVFLLLYERMEAVRNAVASPGGIVKVAAAYGPAIWLVMSLIVIPALVHRPPTFNYRWWVQLIGHIPFVGVPIVWGIGGVGSRPKIRR